MTYTNKHCGVSRLTTFRSYYLLVYSDQVSFGTLLFILEK